MTAPSWYQRGTAETTSPCHSTRPKKELYYLPIWHQELLVKGRLFLDHPVVDCDLGIVSAARLLGHAVPGDADGAGELHPHAIDGSGIYDQNRAN